MREKEQTSEEKIIEKSINLALSGLEIKDKWQKSIKIEEKDYDKFNILLGKIGKIVVDAKCFIDDCLGEKKAKKIHDFISKLLLTI